MKPVLHPLPNSQLTSRQTSYRSSYWEQPAIVGHLYPWKIDLEILYVEKLYATG